MRSKIADRIREKTPEDVRIFVKLYSEIVVRVNQILKEKGYTQRYLAGKLDKSPSEIHKWLSSEHNFTLKSIAKLEAELGETILTVSKERRATKFDWSQDFNWSQEVVEHPSRIKVIPLKLRDTLKGPTIWQTGKTNPSSNAYANAG